MSTLTWQYLLESYPAFASEILHEYKRRNGFVPYEQGFVYVIHAIGSNYYKIGKSINPDKRLLQIAPRMPFSTRFIKVWRSNFMSIAELRLHKSLKQNRANGEWFALEPHELEFVGNKFSAPSIKYAYADEILELLQRDWEEWQKSRERSPKLIDLFDASVQGERAIQQIETLFDQISESLGPSLPEDIQAILSSEFGYPTPPSVRGES